MRNLKLLAGAALVCGGLFATAASAMPVAPLSSDIVSNRESVRWVCSPYGRCWWRPGYYGAYAFHPSYRRHWGSRHRWHRR